MESMHIIDAKQKKKRRPRKDDQNMHLEGISGLSNEPEPLHTTKNAPNPLREQFGSKFVDKYKNEFIDFLKATYQDNHHLEHLDDKEDPLINEKFPESTRYTDEYLRERQRNNDNVRKHRSKEKLNDAKLIKEIIESMNAVCCYGDKILEYLSGSNLCVKCGNISRLDVYSECCEKKELYCLKSILYSIIQFLDKYEVCKICEVPFKGINVHLKTHPLNLEDSQSLHFKVLSAEVNEFGVTLKKNQNEINKIEMDFKFVNMVLTSTLSSYRDFNNHPDVTMHLPYYDTTSYARQDSNQRMEENDDDPFFRQIAVLVNSDIAPKLESNDLLRNNLDNDSGVKERRVCSDDEKVPIQSTPLLDELLDEEIVNYVNDEFTYDGNIIETDGLFLDQSLFQDLLRNLLSKTN